MNTDPENRYARLGAQLAKIERCLEQALQEAEEQSRLTEQLVSALHDLIETTPRYSPRPKAERNRPQELSGTSNSNAYTLTRRELEVLRLIAKGFSTKQVATELEISFKTVVSHRTHLLRKLGVHETASLVRVAIRTGLVRPD